MISIEKPNKRICTYLENAFKTYTYTGCRSSKKLEDIHGGIASDINSIVNSLDDGHEYKVVSKGYEENREAKVEGSEMSKDCDITLFRDGKPILVVMVKMILGNYKQNSINYFENLKGETDNLQMEGIPVFELIFIKDKTPYFNSNKRFSKWEHLNEHNLEKYCKLGKRSWAGPDNVSEGSCVPYFTLLAPYHLNEMPNDPANLDEYMSYYRDNIIEITLPATFKDLDWGNVVYNDYSRFLDEVEKYLVGK